MAEPVEQLDEYWVEIIDLSERLLWVAKGLFADRGCSNAEAILPGTGMCALDLVEKTIFDLIEHGHWSPGSGDKVPIPLARTALKRDFYDLVGSGKYATTVITDSREGEYLKELPAQSPDYSKLDAELTVNSLRRPLKNDPKAIELLEVLIIKGIDGNADMAREMGIGEQEVINIKRRLITKLRNMRRLWYRKDQH